MSSGLVKSELLCPDVWGDRIQLVQLPPMFGEDRIYLDFTIPDLARIQGIFVVEDILHVVDSQGSGYVQRLLLKPESESEASSWGEFLIES